MPSSHKRPPASPLSMEGLSVSSSPRFVSDILLLCEPNEEDFYSGKRARLTSLLDPANGQRSVVESKEDGRFGLRVSSDRRFVCSVGYPTLEEAAGTEGAIWGKRRGGGEESDEAVEEEEDSLVSPKLINMTSYELEGASDMDGAAGRERREIREELIDSEEDFEKERDLNFMHLEDGAKMSFDDLGQIYTNISRKRILSKVQCPNIHFHSHRDGSTTIHRHKTCANDEEKSRKSSHESVDVSSLMDRMSEARKREEEGRQQMTPSGRQETGPEEKLSATPVTVSAAADSGLGERKHSGLSDFSKHVENERYKGTLGRYNHFTSHPHPHHSNTRNGQDSDGSFYLSNGDDDSPGDSLEASIGGGGGGTGSNNYASLDFQHQQATKVEEYLVADSSKRRTKKKKKRATDGECLSCGGGGGGGAGEAEPGVKVNPFYHSRELQRQNGNLASNSNEDDDNNNNNLSKASDLCDVLLDAVVGCAAVAESHCACAQCAEFSRRFRRGLAKAVEAEKRHQHKSAHGNHGHHAGSVPVSRQTSLDVERGLGHGSHGHHPTVYHTSSSSSSRHHPNQQQPVYYLPQYAQHQPNCRAVRGAGAGYRPKLVVQDSKVKLMAYVAVLVLSLLLLVIVVVFLTLFFSQHPMMMATSSSSTNF